MCVDLTSDPLHQKIDPSVYTTMIFFFPFYLRSIVGETQGTIRRIDLLESTSPRSLYLSVPSHDTGAGVSVDPARDPMSSRSSVWEETEGRVKRSTRTDEVGIRQKGDNHRRHFPRKTLTTTRFSSTLPLSTVQVSVQEQRRETNHNWKDVYGRDESPQRRGGR